MGCFLTVCYCYASEWAASGFFWVATRRNGLLPDNLLLLRVGNTKTRKHEGTKAPFGAPLRSKRFAFEQFEKLRFAFDLFAFFYEAPLRFGRYAFEVVVLRNRGGAL